MMSQNRQEQKDRQRGEHSVLSKILNLPTALRVLCDLCVKF
jgi:uncharacterized membrane protein